MIKRLIVHDTDTCWEYPDGSHRCITCEDAKWINEAFDLLWKAEQDYRGAVTAFANHGMRASAKDAVETADHIKAFLEGA